MVGPLARSAEDLSLALEVMAGPVGLDAVGWRLELPPSRATTLSDFRVAVMLDDPNCAVDTQVSDRIQAVADAAARAGATVSDSARPDIDTREAHAIYLQLLRAVTTARHPQDVFKRVRADVAALAPDDDSYSARVARATVQYHRQWVVANEARTHMCLRWAEFFELYDVLLCPAAATPAFPHDQETARTERRITVNGRQEDYNDQLFWAGYSGVVYLPSTVAPAGLAPSGLPVGVQIVGPHLEDRTTIEFARLLANEIGGFVPPPGYD